MSFSVVQTEMRERFAEAAALLNHVKSQMPSGVVPLDNLQKSLKGIWLVALYAAFERGANAIVEAAIREVGDHGPRPIDCLAPIHSLIHFSKIQSVKDCSYNSIFDKSADLFRAVLSEDKITTFDNPLTDRMQNVGGDTLYWLTDLFGVSGFYINSSDRGRLNNLRERRNAVAHGRESASEVGQRFALSELQNVYDAADRACTAFFFAMEDHCKRRLYLRSAVVAA